MNISKKYASIALAAPLFLAACSSGSEPAASDEPTVEATASESATPDAEPTAEAEVSAVEEATTEDAAADFVSGDLEIANYPLEVSTYVSDISGDLTAGDISLVQRWQGASEVMGQPISVVSDYFIDVPRDVAPYEDGDETYETVCVAPAADADSEFQVGCSNFGFGYELAGSGDYVVSKVDVGSDTGEVVEGSRERIGSFTFQEPAPVNSSPVCELVGGEVTVDGDSYVATIQHEGDCSPESAWLGGITAHAATEGGGSVRAQVVESSQVSHTNQETVVSMPADVILESMNYFEGNDFEPEFFYFLSGARDGSSQVSGLQVDVTK